MNRALTWYRRLAWIGILVNVGFVLPALAAPDLLETVLGPGSVELSYVWVAAAGMTLCIASLFYAPAANNPLRYPGYAWLSVAGRALAATFWLTANFRWHLPGPVGTFFLTDGVFALMLFVLLQAGFPPEYKCTRANLARLLRPAAIPPAPNRALLVFRVAAWFALATNLALALPALFAPAWLAPWLQTTVVPFTYLWLGNTGILLVQIALFSIPAAYRPWRFPVYAWIAAIAQGAWALFWVVMAAAWNLSGPARWFALIAALPAVVQILALQRGLPPEYRTHPLNVTRFLAGLKASLGRAFPTAAARTAAAVALVALGSFGYALWANLARTERDTVFADAAMQFKYGAIGLGQANRIPLYLWEVLPELCSDMLPGPGWASLGMLYEPGQDLPVGFAKRQIGYPSAEPNCALCHTSSYRATTDGPSQIILGSPAHELDLQSFQWFLYNCASSPRFTTDAVLAAIRRRHELGWLETNVYRYLVIPFARSGLAAQQKAYQWQKSRPQQGRGRTDTFNPTKITVFHLPDDGTIGTVDLPAIWNQRAREGMWLHWDGNNNMITERNFAAAMAIGATPYSAIPANFQRVTDFVLGLPPPKFPFPVDVERAERGWKIFSEQCASCHAFGSEKIGTVTEIAEIGTDRHRLDSFTPELVAAFHSIAEGAFVFNSYRKTNGYANLPIDGTWARAPFLHNGSVPTLWDLLQPAATRPTRFLRGGNVYDPARMGFITADGAPGAFLFDTSTPGNAATGHSYGTTLSDEQKRDLIEYLKTQ